MTTRKRKRSRGLGSSVAEHAENAERSLNIAVHELREARSAKSCASRANHSINALQSGTRYLTEMQGQGRGTEAAATAAMISREAKDMIKHCVR